MRLAAGVGPARDRLLAAIARAATKYGFTDTEGAYARLTDIPYAVKEFTMQRYGAGPMDALDRELVAMMAPPLYEFRQNLPTGHPLKKSQRRSARGLAKTVADDTRASLNGRPFGRDIALILYLTLTVEEVIGEGFKAPVPRHLPISRPADGCGQLGPRGPAFDLLDCSYRAECAIHDAEPAPTETLYDLVRLIDSPQFSKKLAEWQTFTFAAVETFSWEKTAASVLRQPAEMVRLLVEARRGT